MRMASCCPTKVHHSKGMCRGCYTKQYYSNNPLQRAKATVNMRAWRKNNPERSRDMSHKVHIKKVYNLSIEDYDKLKTKQSNLCAICGQGEVLKHKRLRVDHDHKTNKIRALLCHHCNSGMGQFYDSPKLLRLAADYLDYHTKDING